MIHEIKYANHEEWLAIRHKYIGGSEAAAVLGMSPYKSAYTLWAEKTDKIEEFKGNLTTKVGSYLEDLVAHLFEEETGKKVQRKNATMVNDLYPFACANIDRKVVGENALLEIKTTTSLPNIKKLRNSAEFPEMYYAQVVHYMAVGEYDKAYLAVLINCRELKVYELERDQAEIDALMSAEKEFWTHIDNNTPPAIDGSQSTTDSINEMNSEADDGEFSVDLSFFDNDIRQYLELSESIKKLEEAKNVYANRIKDYMSTATKGESSCFKASYGMQTRNTFDAKAFAAKNPAIDLTPYYKTSTSRVFKLTQKKEN